MITIQGVVRDGQIHPSEPLKLRGQARCLITIFDDDVQELRRLSKAMLEKTKQKRLSSLLQLNREGKLTAEQEREVDAILTEVHQLAAKRARATRLLEQLHLT